MSEVIKSVRIKNVRGLGDHTIELDMIPNKPSILVAPNGSGKSSFALAFKSLNQNRLDLPKEEFHLGDSSHSPELEICTESGSYKATKSSNQISQVFSVFVVNNRNETSASIRNIQGRRIAKSKTLIKPIVLINRIHEDVQLSDTIVVDYSLAGLVRGVLPDIKKVLSNNEYLSRVECSSLKLTAAKENIVNNFLHRLGLYTGTKRQVLDCVRQNDLPQLLQIKPISEAVNALRTYYGNWSDESLCLAAIRLLKLYKTAPQIFKKKILYAKDRVLQDGYEELFKSLNTTWKDIRPKIHGGQLLIEIPDTRRISNGERDIIVFLALLKQAESALQKENSILIIDEVFDYLDDANFISAQYYVTRLIEEIKGRGRNVYPIILSHVDPSYFRSFAFSKMKIYYFNKMPSPMISDRMRKLLRKRGDGSSGLRNANDLISRYMLHFYHDYNSTEELDESILDGDLEQWIDVTIFKDYCRKETMKYLGNNASDHYDAAAVCVWIRECIEQWIYKKLPGNKRGDFIAVHGTSEKISFANDLDIQTPEIFSLLGSLYNDNLHVDDRNGKNLGQTLYAKLNNNTIRTMIQTIADLKP